MREIQYDNPWLDPACRINALIDPDVLEEIRGTKPPEEAPEPSKFKPLPHEVLRPPAPRPKGMLLELEGGTPPAPTPTAMARLEQWREGLRAPQPQVPRPRSGAPSRSIEMEETKPTKPRKPAKRRPPPPGTLIDPDVLGVRQAPPTKKRIPTPDVEIVQSEIDAALELPDGLVTTEIDPAFGVTWAVGPIIRGDDSGPNEIENAKALLKHLKSDPSLKDEWEIHRVKAGGGWLDHLSFHVLEERQAESAIPTYGRYGKLHGSAALGAKRVQEALEAQGLERYDPGRGRSRLVPTRVFKILAEWFEKLKIALDERIENPRLEGWYVDMDWCKSIEPTDRVYMYQAALWCKSDGEAIREAIREKAPALVDSDDSDDWPQCVHVSWDESDSIDHCDAGSDCLEAIEFPNGDKIGAWLGNSLTEEGDTWLRETLAQPPRNEFQAYLHSLWRCLYGIEVIHVGS